MLSFVSFDQNAEYFHQRRQWMILILTDLVDEVVKQGYDAVVLGLGVRDEDVPR